ncbi:MAG: CDP-alcohol phosphatidyltransferase [Rhodospirillaceae bacterium]|jgi:cardiolipin synthase|nr:CDP-alcohol phosphatidyltransferase [Rhodospirillaceae bacterium]|tara:strand:+ start:628 stop:1191 length:564 start_codon:yes stop_codon:yes gene_type:complete
MNLPNLITLGRLFSVPVILWLIIGGSMLAAFWVFFVSALSDAVDGIIAKYFDAETVFGAFLDPIADKALLVSVFIMLGYQGYIEAWLVIMVVFRDLVIIGGAILFQTVTQTLTMRPLAISKVNTFVQLVFAVIVLWVEAYGLDGGVAVGVIGYIVAVTTLWSGTAYVITWSNRAAVMEDTGNPGEPK